MSPTNMMTLEGKSALVCGSTRGIGRACAEEFARLGARVTLFARNEAELEKVRDRLPAGYGKKGSAEDHACLRADFSNPSEVRSVLEKHLATGNGYQILLNNTGGPAAGAILDADPEAFRVAFNSHLICNQILAGALVPGMKKTGYGRILNIISTSVKQPLKNLGVSNTIRAAVANWAKTLAGELAPFGITVNNILPGATLTERLRSLIHGKAAKASLAEDAVEKQMIAEIPAGRFARPEEIAAAAGFLASPAAGYITGINLPVDGGRTASL
ncbi:MAG: SDR family oxidoreductase [Acidobacteriota bacterium]